MSMDGIPLPLDDKLLADIARAQEMFASQGQRVLLLAKKVVKSSELDAEILKDTAFLEDRLAAINIDLVIVGLIALVDPPRSDTAHTVKTCRRAGIRFAMVTGEIYHLFVSFMSLRFARY